MPRESHGTVRGRRAAAALAVALLSLGATACSARSFRIWGTPGPWHKTFGTRAGFEADARDQFNCAVVAERNCVLQFFAQAVPVVFG